MAIEHHTGQKIKYQRVWPLGWRDISVEAYLRLTVRLKRRRRLWGQMIMEGRECDQNGCRLDLFLGRLRLNKSHTSLAISASHVNLSFDLQIQLFSRRDKSDILVSNHRDDASCLP